MTREQRIKQKTKSQNQLQEIDEYKQHSNSFDPHSNLEDCQALQELLSTLTANEQAVLHKRIQGYKIDEMVEKLGISRGTVVRALAKIKKYFSNP